MGYSEFDNIFVMKNSFLIKSSNKIYYNIMHLIWYKIPHIDYNSIDLDTCGGIIVIIIE